MNSSLYALILVLDFPLNLLKTLLSYFIKRIKADIVAIIVALVWLLLMILFGYTMVVFLFQMTMAQVVLEWLSCYPFKYKLLLVARWGVFCYTTKSKNEERGSKTIYEVADVEWPIKRNIAIPQSLIQYLEIYLKIK